MIKKMVVWVLVLALAASMLSGCSKILDGVKNLPKPGQTQSGTDTDTDTDVDTDIDTDTDTGNNNSGGVVYKEAGNELSEYVDALTDHLKIYDDAISGMDSDSMEILSAQMTLAIPMLAVVSAPFYDILAIGKTGAKVEGNVGFGGATGYREKTNDGIKFHSEMVYTADNTGSGFGNEVGDQHIEDGFLNVKTNVITIEQVTKRGGNVIAKTVFESVILADGTCVYQYYAMNPSSDDSAAAKGTAVFVRSTKSDYYGITAEFGGNVDFSYDSIAGKGDVNPDQLAKNCTVTGKFTVKDGKASFTK